MIETVVIGAGAAGIAAARALHDSGRDVLLVEAGERVGGRAHSLALQLGAADSVTVDHGCGWLHSARRNPWLRVAEAAGFVVNRSTPGWRLQWHDLAYPAAEHQAFAAAWDRMKDAARAALPGPDRALGDLVPPDEPWRPRLEAISGYANGAQLDAVSLHDWWAYEEAATEDNWTLPAGYGTLVADHARGLPVRLSTPVTRVDHRGRTIRLEGPAGTIEAARVVVTVPTPVLADGDLVFDPPLPEKRDAAAALPLGLANKVFLAVDDPPWPADAHLIGTPHSAFTGSYRLSPFGRPIVEAFLGGDAAETLEHDGGAAAFAIEELVALLGSDWRQRLRPLLVTQWRRHPFIRGSYSHARVGRAGARATLAAPVDGRLFFAGEACHPSDFSTAHGAYATGVDAAAAILASAPTFA